MLIKYLQRLFSTKHTSNSVAKNEHVNTKIATELTRQEQEYKQVLEQAKAKIESLVWLKKLLTEQKESLSKEFDTLKAQYRKDIIAALHEGCYFESTEHKKKSIHSFSKSKMSFVEVKTQLEQVRYYLIKSGQAVEQGKGTTKLPQRSIAEKEEKKRADSGYIY